MNTEYHSKQIIIGTVISMLASYGFGAWTGEIEIDLIAASREGI